MHIRASHDSIALWQYSNNAFKCRREGDERGLANGKGYGFRIVFPEAVQGPVAVGYGGHFGMGMFMIDRIENSEDESMKEA